MLPCYAIYHFKLIYSDILQTEQAPDFLQWDESMHSDMRALEMVIVVDLLGETTLFADTYLNYHNDLPRPHNESLAALYALGFVVQMKDITSISNRFLLGALMFERFKQDVLQLRDPLHSTLTITVLQKLYLKIHEDQLQRYEMLEELRKTLQKTSITELESEHIRQIFMTSLKNNISFPMEYRVETDRSLETIIQTLHTLSPMIEENVTLVEATSDDSVPDQKGIYKMIATRDYDKDEIIFHQETPLISFHTNPLKEDLICSQPKRNPGSVV
jgi:hypothetical protein